MDTLGYISEVVKDGAIPTGIDSMEELFLYHILEGASSAYKLNSLLNERYYPIAYKNVHRRVKKLFETKLIEEVKVESGYKHGARNYKVTTRGIIYLFSESIVPKDIHNVSLKYSENILFKTFLYSFFQKSTIKNATYSLTKLIDNYLLGCCELTRFFLGQLSNYLHDDNTIDVESGDYPPLDTLYLRLSWYVKSFLLSAVMLKENLVDWRNIIPLSQSLPRREKTVTDEIETRRLLTKDEKFMHAVEEVNNEFRKSYQKMIG